MNTICVGIAYFVNLIVSFILLINVIKGVIDRDDSALSYLAWFILSLISLFAIYLASTVIS